MAHLQIRKIRQEIDNLANAGKEEKDGSLIDLARILRRIIFQFEQKGIQYVIDKHWHKTKRGRYK